MAQDDNKSVQDDQAWFDALSGKADGQAARLRKVLREVELADAAQEDTSHDWQRLQFALKREEVRGRSSYQYYALAASILIVVGTITMLIPAREVALQSPPMAATVMRGASEQVLFSADPARDAKQLEIDLLVLGVKVVKNESADKTELHIAMDYPVRQAVRAVLEARIIPVPEQGDLTVVWIKSTP